MDKEHFKKNHAYFQAIAAQQRLAALAQQGQQEQVERQRAIAAYQQQLQAQYQQQQQLQQRSRPGILGPAAKGRDTRRKPRSGPAETITLDDDDDDDDVVVSGDDDDDEIRLDGEATTGEAEIVLDGTPQTASPSKVAGRRGRPRLDPDTDDVL